MSPQKRSKTNPAPLHRCQYRQKKRKSFVKNDKEPIFNPNYTGPLMITEDFLWIFSSKNKRKSSVQKVNAENIQPNKINLAIKFDSPELLFDTQINTKMKKTFFLIKGGLIFFIWCCRLITFA